MTNIKMMPLPEMEPFATHGSLKKWASDYARAVAEHNVRERDAEIEALRAKTAITMGVGAGDGKLFVHGDYESIKAAQEIVLERDALRVEVERLQAIVEPKREDACLTLDDWRMRAYDLEVNWSRSSQAANKESVDRKRAEARAERLAEALRFAEAALDTLAKEID